MTRYIIVVEAPYSVKVTAENVGVVVDPHTTGRYRLAISNLIEVMDEKAEIVAVNLRAPLYGPGETAAPDTFGGPRPKPTLDGIAYWLDRLQKIEARLAKMDEAHALDVVATDARLDRLSDITNVQDQRIIALEDRCTNMGHKADGAHTRVNALGQIVDKLRDQPGLATLNAAVVDINDRLDKIKGAL